MHMAPALRQTAAGRPVHRGAIAVGLVLFCALNATRPALAQANKDDLAATVAKLNKKALDEYDNLNFEEARKILKDALDFCREAGLEQHPVTARTNMHLGVVSLAGFKQRDVAATYFRKALEIQPDIKLTRSLANPEIQAAFDEVAASVAKSPRPTARATTRPTPASGAAPLPGGDAGISHEPVTRAAQGQSVPIAVTVDPALNADKVVLSYRSGASTEFVTQDMVEATPGNFTAAIPATATRGAQVAYMIQAEKAGLPVASLGSTISPLQVTLTSSVATGIARPGHGDTASARQGAASFYLGVSVGTGLGWASGAGEINAAHVADPAGFAPAQIVHLAPEVGYFLHPGLLLSLQGRIQFLSGLTSQACPTCAAPPSTAIAAFAKLTWLFGDDKLKPYLSASVGGGRIRYVAEFPQNPDCGTTMTSTCVESLPSGVVLLGPGAGILYDVTPGFALLAGANSQLGFPRFTFNLDFNVGVATRF